MKKETAENIFRILKAFIFDEKPVLTDGCDWDEIFYYARIHSLAGIAGYVILKYQLCEDPQICAKFENEMIHTYGYQYRRRRQMEKLIGILNEHHIEHLIMKGYIIKDLYPVPELRWYGDIDFVIHKEDRIKVDELMKSLGYKVYDAWEPVYTYKKDTEYYEIHTEILDSEINNGTQKEYFRDCWQHASGHKGSTYYFRREYHFIYLIAHLAKHASRRGAGLRMYLDIALIIRQYRDSMDWSYILEQLDVLRLKRFFYTVCTVCSLWYGVKPPCEIETIDQDMIDLFTDMTIEGGSFGFHKSNDAVITLKESDRSESRAATLFRQIFPPADEIKARYTYLQKYRWLLPAAWIDRVFRNRHLLLKRIHMAKDLVAVDENEIQKIRDLNKEIGL